MGKPTTVVFDVGNVLLRWDPRHLYRTHLRRRGADGVVPRQCLHARLEPGAGPRPRLGRGGGASRQGSSRRTRRRSAPSTSAGTRPSPACSRTMSPCSSACARRACRITASPISPARNSSWRRSAIPFLAGFDGIIVSGDERLLKPDPAIYRLLLDRYGLEAEDCVFIDDSKANVEAPARSACTRSITSSRSISRRSSGATASRPEPALDRSRHHSGRLEERPR